MEDDYDTLHGYAEMNGKMVAEIEALRAENAELREALAEAHNLLHNLTAIIPGNDTAGLEVARLLRAAASINGVNDAAS